MNNKHIQFAKAVTKREIQEAESLLKDSDEELKTFWNIIKFLKSESIRSLDSCKIVNVDGIDYFKSEEWIGGAEAGSLCIFDDGDGPKLGRLESWKPNENETSIIDHGIFKDYQVCLVEEMRPFVLSKEDHDNNQHVMGVCLACGHNLWGYYGAYCPLCEPPLPNEKPNNISLAWSDVSYEQKKSSHESGHYNLCKVLNYLQAKGKPGQHIKIPGLGSIWSAIISAQKKAGLYDDFGNDRVCKMSFAAEHYSDHPILQDYVAAAREVIGAEKTDFWVSW